MPQKVIWHLRMNREGRTCIGCEKTVAERGGAIFKIEVVRMQEAMAIEYMDKEELLREFPYASESGQERPSPKTIEAGRQYLVHAANAKATREVVDLLTRLYRPKAGLRARLDDMLTPPTKEPSC